MGLDDKIQEAIGKAKEGIGEALGDEDLSRDGRKDRLEASTRELGEKIQEKAGLAADTISEKAEDIKEKFKSGSW